MEIINALKSLDGIIASTYIAVDFWCSNNKCNKG